MIMIEDGLILSKNLALRQKPILKKGLTRILIKVLILTKELKII